MKLIGVGDLAYSVFHPLAERVIDPILGTDLGNCAGCSNRRERWNNLQVPWFDAGINTGHNGNMGDFIVIKQIQVEGATDAEDAIKKMGQGRVIAVQAQEKPAPPVSRQPGQPVTIGR